MIYGAYGYVGLSIRVCRLAVCRIGEGAARVRETRDPAHRVRRMWDLPLSLLNLGDGPTRTMLSSPAPHPVMSLEHRNGQTRERVSKVRPGDRYRARESCKELR